MDDDSLDMSADAEEANAEFRWKDHVHIQCRKGNNYVFTCNYCSAHQKALTGGCSRFKTHLLGGVGVRRCLGAPDSLILSLRAAVESKSRARAATLERSASVTEAEREDRRNQIDLLRESLSCDSAQVNKCTDD